MKLVKSLPMIILLMSTTATARWKATDSDKLFKDIYAQNGTLVGIEAKTNLPYKWDNPFWKKLSDQQFISLATDGINIAGVKLGDQNAYLLDRTIWKKLGSQLNLFFEQLVFGQKTLLGRCKDPHGFVFAWNKSSWSSVGGEKFWSIDAAGSIVCGVQQSYETKALNYRASTWQKKDWQKLSSEQFTQVVTNGVKIIGIGQAPKSRAFEWSSKKWIPLGKERLIKIAFNKNMLCGIQEKIQLILQWTGKKWIALDTKKFTHVATDGKIIYGLANDKRVYYWTNK